MSQMNLLIIKQEHQKLDFKDIPNPRHNTYKANEKERQTYLALAHFLNEGMPVNMTDADGNTPLHIALMTGNWYAAAVLVQRQAPMDLPNKQGLSPAQIIQLKLDSFKDIHNYIVNKVPEATQKKYKEVQQIAQILEALKKSVTSCHALLKPR